MADNGLETEAAPPSPPQACPCCGKAGMPTTALPYKLPDAYREDNFVGLAHGERPLWSEEDGLVVVMVFRSPDPEETCTFEAVLPPELVVPGQTCAVKAVAFDTHTLWLFIAKTHTHT